MRNERIELLLNLTGFSGFELVSNSRGIEFVLEKTVHDREAYIDNITDKTAFESTVNHFHLLDRLTEEEFNALYLPCKKLCEIFLRYLCSLFPQKRFCVYVTATKGDSLILRFHQYWKDEPPYHSELWTDQEWVICRTNEYGI